MFEDIIDWIYDHFEWIVGIVIAVLVVGLITAWIWTDTAWVNTKETFNSCHVNGKESVDSNGSHKYRIYTDECGVFSVSDEMWLGIYNSADTYNKITVGEHYSFNTIGWRNGFFSTFPNIVKVIKS